MIYLLMSKGFGSGDKPEIIYWFKRKEVAERIAGDLCKTEAGYTRKYYVESVKGWYS